VEFRVPVTPAHRYQLRRWADGAGVGDACGMLGLEAERNALLVNLVAALGRCADAVWIAQAALASVVEDLDLPLVVHAAAWPEASDAPLQNAGTRYSSAELGYHASARSALAAHCAMLFAESEAQRAVLLSRGAKPERIWMAEAPRRRHSPLLAGEMVTALRAAVDGRRVVVILAGASSSEDALIEVASRLACGNPGAALAVTGLDPGTVPGCPDNLFGVGTLDRIEQAVLASVACLVVVPWVPVEGTDLAMWLEFGPPIVAGRAVPDDMAFDRDRFAAVGEIGTLDVDVARILRDWELEAAPDDALAQVSSCVERRFRSFLAGLQHLVFLKKDPRREVVWRRRHPPENRHDPSMVETPAIFLDPHSLRTTIDVPGFVGFMRDEWDRRAIHDPEFKDLLLAGRTFGRIVDVGANMGQSIVSLRTCFPDAQIQCFEANPLLHPVLRAVAEMVPGRVEVFEHGLGSSERSLSLLVPVAGGRHDIFCASTRRAYFTLPWVVDRYRSEGGFHLHKIRARLVPGDGLEIGADLIKIDVEGAELDVIQGLTEVIRRDRPVIFAENSDFESVTRYLSELGYVPFRADDDHERLVRIDGWPWPINTIYLHETRVADAVTAARPAIS